MPALRAAYRLNKPKPNWDDKRPDLSEQISSRLSIKSVFSDDSPGGLPTLTNEEFAGVIGSVGRPLHRILLGARFAEWPTERDQLKEIILRRSWESWREKHREGAFTVRLNLRVADLVMYEWVLPIETRNSIADTYRAKHLRIGYRRYRDQLREHHRDLIAWLDTETTNALQQLRRKLRG